MVLTGVANLLFAVINPEATYWAFGFPAAILSVFGADFVFASGTLFVAKVCLPHEQSVGGALFQTMTQVRALSSPRRGVRLRLNARCSWARRSGWRSRRSCTTRS